MSRVFDAPRELVSQAHTDPAHITQWWGQRRSTTIIDMLDVRPGGAWRFIERDPEGNEYAFRGEFREVVPPERLVYTFEFEGMPGRILVETVTFDEHDGMTTVTSTSLFESVADRDGMLESGMESGAIESWDRLAELLERLK
ncbi:MAG: SRPBCC family protein [Chloroflexi bacterium]|nr:SRPBCC family protein [Chloroflexota bacterium]